MSTPAGWYDDGSGRQRWFDGAQWTEQYQDAVVSTPPSPDASSPEPVSPYSAPTVPVAGPAGPVGPYAAPPAQSAGAKRAVGLAVAALIVGIVAFLGGLIPVWGIIVGAAAIGLGVFALVRGQSKLMSIIGGALGGLALLTSVITTVGLIAGLGTTPGPVAEAPAATQAPIESSPTAEPAPAEPTAPVDQLAFLELVETARTSFTAAQTDLQRTEALATRNRAICEAVPGGTFAGWLGKVDNVGSDFIGDAETSAAYVQITIAQDVTIKTWNNGLSDIGDNTMIPQGTPLYDSLVALTPGTEVRVSGAFVPSSSGCVKTSNLTDTFSAKTPEFIVTFSEVAVQG